MLELPAGKSAAKLFFIIILYKKEYLQGEKTNFSKYTEEDAKKVIELLKTNEYTDKQISEITGMPVKGFIAKIRRRETWKHLTNDYEGILGKGERKSFNKNNKK